MQTSEITSLIIGVMYFFAFIAVLTEAGNRRIGTSWAALVSIFATPFVGVVCVAMSPRKDKNLQSEGIYDLDYRYQAAVDMGKLMESPMFEVIRETEKYKRLERMVSEDPYKLFSGVILDANTSEQLHFSWQQYLKIKSHAYYKSAKVIGYYV